MGKLFLALLFACLSYAIALQYQNADKCDLKNLNALEPSYTLQAEGGTTEFWDYRIQDLVCPAVSMRRHRIKQRGLLMPLYHGSPIVVYVAQGKTTYGIAVSGCPETFELHQDQQQGQGQQQGQTFQDSHQKIEQAKQGDIVAIDAGSAHWFYNDGNEELILIVFLHNGNQANKMDWNPRSYLLAGNPKAEQQQPQQQQPQPQQQQQPQELGNVLRGISSRILAKVMGLDEQTAQKLQGPNDNRGHIIIIANGLQLIRSPFSQQQRANGLEQINICNADTRENIADPSQADVFNPQAGQWKSLNSQNLRMLEFLGLSAGYGLLFKDALMSPRWYINAHTVLYGLRGQARIQIVNHRGQALFDSELRQGQVLSLPQSYMIVIEAGNQGFEWVEFNTNDNAMFNTIAGRNSVFRGIPSDVLANSNQIPRELANIVKNSRKDTLLFRGPKSQQGGQSAAA